MTTNESIFDPDYIGQLISDCDKMGISCIVDDSNSNFLIYDQKNGKYTDYHSLQKSGGDIDEMLEDPEMYDSMMLPASGEDFKKFAVEWNSLQKKTEEDGVYQTKGCMPIHGNFTEAFGDYDLDDYETGKLKEPEFYLRDCDKKGFLEIAGVIGAELKEDEFGRHIELELSKDAVAEDVVNGLLELGYSENEIEDVDVDRGFATIAVSLNESKMNEMTEDDYDEDDEDDEEDKKVMYKWVASCSDGGFTDESERVFDNQEDCYNDMMNHALDKMKWNIEWDDVTSDVETYEEDDIVKSDGEMGEDGEPSGDNWGIGYRLECHPHMIQHKSYSGLYTYKIVKVD